MTKEVRLCFILLVSLLVGSFIGVEKGAVVVAQDAGANENKELDKLILGRFDRVSNPRAEDFIKFLEAMEFKPNAINRAKEMEQFSVDVFKYEDGRYAIDTHHSRVSDPRARTRFTPGKEFDATLFDGRHYKVTISFKGNDTMVRDEIHANFKCHNVYVFDKDGVTVNYLAKNVTATQMFRRFQA